MPEHKFMTFKLRELDEEAVFALFQRSPMSREEFLAKNSRNESIFYELVRRNVKSLDWYFEKYNIAYSDLVVANINNYTPLMWLCWNKFEGLETIFDKWGLVVKDVLGQNIFGVSSFHGICCYSGNNLVKRVLQESGMTTEDLIALDRNNCSLFYQLCCNGNYSDLPKIFDEYKTTREDLLQLTSHKYSPFLCLCLNHYSDLPKIFDEFKITREDLLQLTSNKQSPFMWLCENNYSDLPKIFDEFKITREDLLQLSSNKYSPFYCLCKKSYSDLPKIFDEFKITREDLLQLAASNTSPFYCLCGKNYSDLSKIFDKFNITREDLLQLASNSSSPFYFLCENNYSDLPKIFDEFKISREDLLQFTSNKKSPFYCLFKNQYSDLTKIIIKNEISYQDMVLSKVIDASTDLEEKNWEGNSLMYILSRYDYEFPRNLWHVFPKKIDNCTILQLVRYQSPFLSQVILNKNSRRIISRLSSSLLLFLDAKFGDIVPEIPSHCLAVDPEPEPSWFSWITSPFWTVDTCSLITTEFDAIERTCSLYWLEERFPNIPKLKISDFERKQYEEQIKPMITLQVSCSISGSGATSNIYKCRHRGKDRALKAISAESLSSGKQEIAMLKKIGLHDNICGMINHAEYSKEIKIVLPLYDMDVRMLLNSSGRMPIKTAVFIVHSILKALAYLEPERIVHADVKPANILLRKTSELEMEVALCDFGLSIQLPEGKMFSDAPPYGTESYLSPERQKRNFGTKTDVWSLGITFYEMLYQKTPETKDGLEIPITPIVPDAVKQLLRKMICPVERRLSAKELMNKYLWEELMLSDWMEIGEMKESKGDLRQLTSLPGPNVAGLVLGDKLLGKGAFGEVYDGYFRKGKERKKVAIKKIRKHQKLALKEVKQCMLIKSHKYLCKVYTCSEDYEYFYIAMEFCPSNYRTFLNERKLSKGVVARHLGQLLKGVYALYLQKIVHRDLKPENILLTSDNKIKIADFGLSKKLKKSLGNTSNLGTRNYMAPEVFGKDYGRAADIWSVGVIYLEMLGIDIRQEFAKLQETEASELPSYVNKVESKEPNIQEEESLSQTKTSSSDEKSNLSNQDRSSFVKSFPISVVDSCGDPILSAFNPEGWIAKLREFVSTNIKDPVSQEFLLSIFVIARKRPTAFQLLKKYQFSENGLTPISDFPIESNMCIEREL